MNRVALLVLLLASSLGLLLVHLGEAEVPARLAAIASLLSIVALGLLLLTHVVRRLPRPALVVLATLLLVQSLRSLYFLVCYHWLTGGLYFIVIALGVLLSWNIRLGIPQLSRRTSIALAACCGLGLVVQAHTFPPRDLLPTIRRWKREPRTRTPLSLLGHTGLLGGLAVLAAGGILSLRPPQFEQR